MMFFFVILSSIIQYYKAIITLLYIVGYFADNYSSHLNKFYG